MEKEEKTHQHVDLKRSIFGGSHPEETGHKFHITQFYHLHTLHVDGILSEGKFLRLASRIPADNYGKSQLKKLLKAFAIINKKEKSHGRNTE